MAEDKIWDAWEETQSLEKKKTDRETVDETTVVKNIIFTKFFDVKKENFNSNKKKKCLKIMFQDNPLLFLPTDKNTKWKRKRPLFAPMDVTQFAVEFVFFFVFCFGTIFLTDRQTSFFSSLREYV